MLAVLGTERDEPAPGWLAAWRVLNLATRLWRDGNGLTWLETAPLIQMLPVLLGHRNGDITTHYSAPSWRSCRTRPTGSAGKSPALVVLKTKAATASAVTA